MKILQLHLAVALFLCHPVHVQSFSVNSWTKTVGTWSTSTATLTSTSLHMNADVEALLRKARELREQAEADEARLHTDLINKKKAEDDETDKIIDALFPVDIDASASAGVIERVAETIQTKKLSAACLKRVVQRLHEREICARGLSHVEPSLHHTHVKFEVVADVNQGDLERVEGLIPLLIDAASVVDERMLTDPTHAHSKKHVVDSTHWASGKLSKVLKEKANFLGREHDDQFKKRLEEYYEAARRKEHVRHEDESSTSMFP